MLGLPPVGLYALEYLDQHGSLLQVDLARLLYVRPQTAGKLLSRLQCRGWVSRRPSGDRNHITVTITDGGRSVLADAHDQLPAGLSRAALNSPAPVLTAPGRQLVSNPDDNLDEGQKLQDALEALRPLLCAIITDVNEDHHHRA